ncbi:helix-turn-helix transcriptional regulator [Streptacidiphilus rugosus]|uniref:helix-turn-helix transcriptional regulator n=1 Tax=Streptacidiphilus rugosus TaxID=405783 RepID=UPI00056BA093|nr:LuxR family transcriptional regulator [Streptacidiphilus rugosus]
MVPAAELCDRGAELGALQAGLASAQESRGRALIFTGPVGIGTTSLLNRAEGVASPVFQIAAARASRLERDLPYGVVRQLFTPIVAQLGAHERRELLSGATAQARRALDDTAPADSVGGEFSVLHSLFWLTSDLCDDRPLLLLIDEAQWADTASLRYLAYLVPRLPHLGCFVVAAVSEPAGQQQPAALLEQVMSDPACSVLRPEPLGLEATAAVVGRQLLPPDSSQPVDGEFARACHAATGGNPLLVTELARSLARQGVLPAAPQAATTAEAGARTVADRVTQELAGLPAECGRLARAAAVLGERSPLEKAAQLGGMPLKTARQALTALEATGRVTGDPPGEETADIVFVHPVVHAAVHDLVPVDERGAAHLQAAELLDAAGTPPERSALHLLHTAPGQRAETVQLLLDAADSAMARGSPETAVTLMRRCVGEPPPEDRRAGILYELGLASLLIDPQAAVGDLAEAHKLAHRPKRRAEIALALGSSLLLLHCHEEALEVWQGALAEVPEDETELLHQLQACILSIPFYEPGRSETRRDILRRVSELRSRDTYPTAGGRVLDCVIAGHDTVLGDPRAVPRALRALHNPADLLQLTAGDVGLSLGWLALISADRDEVMTSLDEAVAHAHHAGSMNSLAVALTYRAMAWLARGNLAEAETDARQAVSAADAASVRLPRLVLGPLLADLLLEQGRLAEAEAALVWVGAPDPVPSTGLMYHLLLSRCRLLRRAGKPEQALDSALAAGRSFVSAGGENPALVPWQSEAALCLHVLQRNDEARVLADEGLRLARNWSAPRAWGRALRVLGRLEPSPEEALIRFREAATRLRPSNARLEYAKALGDYGSVLRDTGQVQEAAPVLQEALSAALQCGASPLAERIRAELAAAGIAPAHALESTGVAALTPTQRRVCELAAAGRTNREIAKEVFTTTKATEAHLQDAYRKLGINGRQQLAEKLAAFAQPR